MKYSIISLAILAALASSATNAFTASPINQGLKTYRSSTHLSGIRFNKLPPAEDKVSTEKVITNKLYTKSLHKDIYPLTAVDYPLKPDKAEILRKETEAESVVLSDDMDDGRGNKNFRIGKDSKVGDDPVTGAKIDPFYPGDKGYEKELQDVVDWQKIREKNDLIEKENPVLGIRWPNIWFDRKGTSNVNPFGPKNDEPQGLRPQDVADAVEGEYPNFHQQTFVYQVAQGKRNLLDSDLLKRKGNSESVIDFIGTIIRMSAINTWTIDAVAPVNFMLKWHFGVPRPEEVAFMISCRNSLRSIGVKKEVRDVIQNNFKNDLKVVLDITALDLQNATSFTAYDGGSPCHPSFPAMHSAGGTISLWLPALYDISAEDYEEALRIDYGVAFARTVAGVHYPQDNIAGLNNGQRIIREQLPKFLKDNYGYDEVKVKARLEALSFDWKDFISANPEGNASMRDSEGNEWTAAKFLKMAKKLR